MAGSIERKFQQTPIPKESSPRYRFKSPTGSIPVIIIDTNRVIRNNNMTTRLIILIVLLVIAFTMMGILFSIKK